MSTSERRTRVELGHGSGGPAMRTLIRSVFLKGAASPEALAMGDGAAIPWGDRFLVLTTDAHVVKPPFFPGGDIGRLSICGVVNDLAMMGACDVLGLTSSVILEEGFPLQDLARLQQSVDAACAEAGASVLTGDTKVMGRGEIDGVVFSTAGLGVTDRVVRDSGAKPGDVLLITGTIGDHGLAVLATRHKLGLAGTLQSDVAPLNDLVRVALAAGGTAIHAMKDPTRGGVVSALSEMAEKAGLCVQLQEEALPMSPAARAASELLGIDPLSVANEGKALLAVGPAAADRVLASLRSHRLGRQAALIGTFTEGEAGRLSLDTGFGTRRLIERDGEALPRIC